MTRERWEDLIPLRNVKKKPPSFQPRHFLFESMPRSFSSSWSASSNIYSRGREKPGANGSSPRVPRIGWNANPLENKSADRVYSPVREPERSDWCGQFGWVFFLMLGCRWSSSKWKVRSACTDKTDALYIPRDSQKNDPLLILSKCVYTTRRVAIHHAHSQIARCLLFAIMTWGEIQTICSLVINWP